MNKSTLRNLGIVLFALIAILVAIEMGDRGETVTSGDKLFADLKDRINDVSMMTVERPGGEETVVSNASGTWAVSGRDEYPASMAKIREVLLALADARVLERKTSNPERYAQLGVDDPDAENGKGIRLTVAGPDFSYALIIGNVNQGSNRFVRIADRADSVLIDQNPSLPDSVSGWLRDDILDIDAADIRSAIIRHADSETIRIEKATRDQTDFTVPDLPAGRELSYPTVANSIGGALNDLRLEDVRRTVSGDADVVIDFATFDGLSISVQTIASDGDGDGETWVSLVADVVPEAPDTAAGSAEDPGADADAMDDATADTTDNTSAETADQIGDDTREESSPDTATDRAGDAAARAAGINARVQGWQFRIPEFKANQLTRRWDDILKAETD